MLTITQNSWFNCETCLFRQTICNHITDQEFETLFNATQQLRFKRNEFISKQGAKTEYIVYLSKGRVKMSCETSPGRNIILTISNAPILLGGAIMLNDGINIFSIIAIEDCDVCMINIDILKSFIVKNGELSLKLLEFLSSMFRDSIYNFISLAHKQVNGRIADILMYLAKTIYQNNSFTLTITRKEIAEFAGCSQENVIHTLTKFHKEGIIRSEGKSIEIIEMEKLIQISQVG